MAMTNTSRREFYKLRELVHFMLLGSGVTPKDSNDALCCYFCRMRLDTTGLTQHGDTRGPKFELKLTIHHVDGDHGNSELSNQALSHTKCHKSYHRREANYARRVQ